MKGAGSIGSGGVRSRVVSIIGRRGGVAKLVNASGMRTESLSYWRSRFAGKSAAQVRELAEHGMAPVRVVVYRVGGRTRAELEDGRHRVTAAREAGATRIRVEAQIQGERGALSTTWTGIVRI
jgi:hypothetical protein